MKATGPLFPFRFLVIALALAAAASACAAETKVGKGGKAGKAPETVNAFVVLPPDEAGTELATRNIHLPSAAGLLGWTSFSAPSPGKVDFDFDSILAYEILGKGEVGDDGEIQAFRIKVDGVSASGGTLYTVTFAPADLVPKKGEAFLQPATFAVVEAAVKSRLRSGLIRVLAAKFEKGAFTYKLAIK